MPPGAEDETVGLWMRKMGLDGDPRVRDLEYSERRALAYIASRSEACARGLVEHGTLARMRMPGSTREDQMPYVLALYDRLMQAGTRNIDSYFLRDFGLLCKTRCYVAGTIKEMACVADVATEAAGRGFRTHVSELLRVPQNVIPSELLARYRGRWPVISARDFQNICASAEVDARVSGDRLVEVKLQGGASSVFSRLRVETDREYVRKQVHALKLMAVAKGMGLRGVEFDLFCMAVNRSWLRMVKDVAEAMQVGVKVVLQRYDVVSPIVRLDTMPPPESKQRLDVRFPALRKPAARSEGVKTRWGVERDDLAYMLHFVQDEGVRRRVRRSPAAFTRHIGERVWDIMGELKSAVELHFSLLRQLGRNTDDLGNWMTSWNAISGSIGGDCRMEQECARKIALLASGVKGLVEDDEELFEELKEMDDKDGDEEGGGSSISVPPHAEYRFSPPEAQLISGMSIGASPRHTGSPFFSGALSAAGFPAFIGVLKPIFPVF